MTSQTYAKCTIVFEPLDGSEPARIVLPKAFMPVVELEVEEQELGGLEGHPSLTTSRVIGGTFSVRALRDEETGEVFHADRPETV